MTTIQKRIIFLLVGMMLLAVLTRAEWTPLNKQQTSPYLPVVTLISDDVKSTVIKFEITGFDLKNLEAKGKHYRLADLLSESFTMDPGFPEVSYLSKVLAIPGQAGVSVEVLETGEMQTFSNIDLPPARPSWQEGSPEPPYTENDEAYYSINAYPGKYVQLDPPSVFRDFRITRVSVFPIQYIPSTRELQVVSSITIRINYGPGELINPKFTPKKPIAPSFGAIYRSFIFNYENVLNTNYNGKEDGHELMLCIMPDEFVASFEPYADWKRKSGIDIHVTKFSDIGANASNPAIIKNHILDAYQNWDVTPTYILILGDDGVFPTHTQEYGFPNEDYFVELEGNDYFPELFIGRLTNQSAYGLQVLVNKFIKYEKTPWTANTDWFKKGICCSNNAYASQVLTKRFAAERMLLDGGFTSVDTMMSDSPCTYDVSDVIAAINNGRSWLNYRGEGWSSGWWASCTPLNLSDLPSISNGQKFTFVTSIGCGVAMFQSSGNCFGEEWLEMGSISTPKGAAAFIGPVGNTHTTYNNYLDKGIYIGMFQEGMETSGQALVRGKLNMYMVFGNEYYVDYHYRIYCILGDPSLRIWKDVPQAVTMNYPSSVPFGNNLVEFTINYASTGLPVFNAQVCVTSADVFSSGYTYETGKAYLEIDSEVQEELTVWVRGGSVIPAEGVLYVVQPSGPYVVKESYTINDVTGGNNNGMMDYGETNLLSLTMKNVGVQMAENVNVTISTNDTYITITDNSEYYGSIPAGSTSVITDGFAYSVANNIPNLHIASFEVTAISGSDAWLSYITITAHAPILEYLDYEIADPTGNNNGKLDPGETVELIITIKNSGSSMAYNVLGVLTEADPFVTLNASQVNLGNITGGSEAYAVYYISASENTPAGHLADLTLSLNADLGITGTGELEVIIGQIPVLILDMDGNSNSAPNMEEALNTIDIAFETLTSFPPDLNLYSTIFLCLGVFPQNHSLTSSEGQILADYLNYGGSLYMEGGDTWAYDQQTSVHQMFNINGVSDGSADMSIVVGQPGTFTEGMSFNYNGDNSWMDHIEPIAPAFKIFDNQSPLYGTGVAYDDGNYKTIGTSHEFGGLVDGASPSTKEELMAAYLEFFGVAVSLQASFFSNTTEVCVTGTVNFVDQSSGNPITWTWLFEGGTPSSSTQQNPSIVYNTPGTFDVLLTVSDGVENSTLLLNDYITVYTLPGIPPAPTGPSNVCASEDVSTYTATSLPGIITYQWVIEPASAGNITNSGLTAFVVWTSGFLGDANVKVAGENICGTGIYSEPITTTRYLPEVSFEPLDWVCLNWPAFELTGGWPEGGEYSGPGVNNGWFYPSIAGIGTHTITYTYTDLNNCENFANETILVDPCTGVNDITGQSGIKIYPNPTNGRININFDQDYGTIEVSVVNTLNELVYTGSLETNSGNKFYMDLSFLVKGIYFIKLKNEQTEKILKIILQ